MCRRGGCLNIRVDGCSIDSGAVSYGAKKRAIAVGVVGAGEEEGTVTVGVAGGGGDYRGERDTESIQG